MKEDAFAFRADLCCPDGSGDLGIEDFDMSTVGIPYQGRDLPVVIRPAIHHGQQDAFDPQLRIDLPLDLVDGLKQLFQSFMTSPRWLPNIAVHLRKARSIHALTRINAVSQTMEES